MAIKVTKYRYNRKKKKKRTGKRTAGWQRQGARQASTAGAQAADAEFPDLVYLQKVNYVGCS